MREKRFVEQNQKNWARFEEKSQTQSRVNPEEFSDLFSQITEDLSYARTHYPKRSIRVYLNGIAQNIYLKLNRQRGNNTG
ncbi:MAG: stage II sporulation protein M, partial [Cryomorphaceae bacterium]